MLTIKYLFTYKSRIKKKFQISAKILNAVLKNIFKRKILSKKIFIKFIITTLSTSNILPIESKPYEITNFNVLEPGSLNISVYIFHDRNRNGTYDLGDKSMAGVETELIKPDGMIVNAKSNKDGYTNFKMALGSLNYRHINKDSEIYCNICGHTENVLIHTDKASFTANPTEYASFS